MGPINTTNFELYDVISANDPEEIKGYENVILEGWVRTNRDNGSIGFIEFNDGTYFKNVQLVYNNDSNNHDVLSSLNTGAAIKVVGKLVLTPGNKQPFEIQVTDCELEGDVDEDYPLQKK